MNLPNDWSSANAEEVCERISVGIVVEPSKHYTSDPEGIRAFRSANVRPGKINSSNWVCLSSKGHALNSKSHLRAGDVVIVRTGAPGTACVITEEFAGSNCIDLIFARPCIYLINSAYLCVYINSEHGKRQALNMQGGLAQQHLNVGAFQKIKIPIPPLPEQRKIADILTTWDESLEKLGDLIVAQERRKKALMQKLLTGNIRFPAFANKPWKKVRMGEMLKRVFRPIDWSAEMSLSLISLRRRCGGLFRRPDMLGSEYKTQDLHELQADDFLISKRQVAHGAWGLVTPEYAGSHVSKEYAILVNNAPEKLFMPFFAWLCQTPRMIRLSRVASTGVHIEKLIFDPEVFLRDSIRIPPTIEEQRQIAAILDTADQELMRLRLQRTAVDKQKQGLMQRLLTGRIRVKTK